MTPFILHFQSRFLCHSLVSQFFRKSLWKKITLNYCHFPNIVHISSYIHMPFPISFPCLIALFLTFACLNHILPVIFWPFLLLLSKIYTGFSGQNHSALWHSGYDWLISLFVTCVITQFICYMSVSLLDWRQTSCVSIISPQHKEQHLYAQYIFDTMNENTIQRKKAKKIRLSSFFILVKKNWTRESLLKLILDLKARLVGW